MIKFLLFTLLISCSPEEAKKYEQKTKESFQHKCDGSPIETQNNGVKVFAYEALEDEIGVYKRFRYYKLKNSGVCIKQEVELSYFEKGIRKRAGQNIQCASQDMINEEVFLEASGNYYEYRNQKIYLSLNPYTGTYRRIIYGEDHNGAPLTGREIGCWSARFDNEDELTFPKEHGLQIYFDQPNSASSNIAKSNEIYKITSSGPDWHFISQGKTFDWSFAFCPELSVEWKYCTDMRSGNIMYYPPLTDEQKDNLLTEAILIRNNYSFVETTKNEFEKRWEEVQESKNEKPQVDFKYKVIFSPDLDFYTTQSHISYLLYERPIMPDLIEEFKQRPVCYDSHKRVRLTDGSVALIRGQVCLGESGEYYWVEYK